MPFELQIMEIIGESIAYGLKLKTQDILMEFETIRQSSYARISIESLRELAFIKSKVDKHHRNADLAHQAWLDLLAYDEDMIGLYLTEYRKSDSSDLSEIELLLESCAKQIAEVCRSVYDLKDSVQNVEITTGFMLDAVRNQLLAFEIRINIITMGFGIGVFITAIYGMNLYSGIEEHPRALLFKSYKLHRPNQNTLPFGAMEPAFNIRGDFLLLTNYSTEFVRAGDIVVFRIEGRDIPIVHRVIKVHEKNDGYVKFLTKGDNNQVDDRGLYSPGQLWLERKDIIDICHILASYSF
ncbi:unnamed protein product [Rotaria sordida]|uniref:Signal peptidase complex catalytic subunit SEC11 n=1 Tax=Rotaria sordida TaxID=392033 RepID=A0A819G5I9_9BILA|nr:unnamed protein product [Rotaria sordida]